MKKANLGSSQLYDENFKIFNSNIPAETLEGNEVTPSSIIISAPQEKNKTTGKSEDTGKYAIMMTDASKVATTVVKNYAEINGKKVLIDDKLRDLTSSCSTLSNKVATMGAKITNLTATFNNTFNIVNNLKVDSLKENTKFVVGFPNQQENEKLTIQEAFNLILNEIEALSNRVTNLENQQIIPAEPLA